MIKLDPIGPNKNIVKVKTEQGQIEILFSYSTPVACAVEYPDDTVEHICTDIKYSVTTSKHINTWIQSLGYCVVNKSEKMLQKTIKHILSGALCIYTN